MSLWVEGDALALSGRHKYGYVMVDRAHQVLQVIQRTNPHKKWDWWELGGRYTGRLVSRGAGITGEPGLLTAPAQPGTCDQCRVGDLDLAAMQANVTRCREAEWAAAQARPEEERALLYGITEAMTRNQYVMAPPLSAFAILDDAGWHEQGDMGWFWYASNENPEWPAQFQAYLHNLMANHPEKFLAIVDCHI